jgi:hypothetical protein
MAMAQWRSGDLKGAEATLKKAVEMSPGFVTPLELLGKVQALIKQAR